MQMNTITFMATKFNFRHKKYIFLHMINQEGNIKINKTIVQNLLNNQSTINMDSLPHYFLRKLIFFNLQQYCAMFTTNTVSLPNQPLSSSKQNSLNIIKEWSQSQKRKTINMLRQLSMRQTLEWNVSYERFALALQKQMNSFSLFLTLFEISEDPLWRNRIAHICSLIKRLHNICIDTNGGYLNQLSQLDNYQGKLVNIFYLNDQQLQENFKNLIKIYLNYNLKFCIFDEQGIASGLIDAGKNQKVAKLPEYLWIVSQIKMGEKTIGKILKIGQDCIHSNESNKMLIILPILSILSNYIYHERRPNILDELLSNATFQNILILSLQSIQSLDIAREALLLCNNIMAKSFKLSQTLLSSQPLVVAASAINCEEQFIFQKLISIRNSERQ